MEPDTPITLNMLALHPGRCKASEAIHGQGLKVPGHWGSQNSRQSVRKGGKVVNPTYRSPLRTRKYSCDSFLLEAGSTHSAAGRIMSVKSSIEPATFQHVAQCLNELRQRVRHTGTLYCKTMTFNYAQTSSLIVMLSTVLYLMEGVAMWLS
jgi:hypothetical protein